MIPKKTDYATEFQTLTREQYKNSKHLTGILKALGEQCQELEDAGYDIFENFSENFGIKIDPQGRIDPLLKTARMFSAEYGNIIDPQDLVDRIKTNVYVMSNRPSVNSITGLSDFVYGFKSHVHQSYGFIDVSILGDISSDNGRKAKVLRSGYLRMMPLNLKLWHMLESRQGDFSFHGFTLGSEKGFYNSRGTRDDEAGMSRVVINENGLFKGEA